MIRIQDFSVALTEDGMWAKVQCMVEGEQIDGIVARLSSDLLCFANNCDFLNGSNKFPCFSPDWNFVTNEYNNGWTIKASDCGSCFLPDILSKEGMDTTVDIGIIGIYKEDGTIVKMDGSSYAITTPVGFFNDKYTKNKTYSGMGGYHSHHGETFNTPITDKRGHKIGVELEVEFNSSSLKNEFTRKNKSNWFFCERDGSLSDSTGVEIITIPMLPKDIKDMETWKPLIEYLTNKAKSWDSSRCGLHVHIGREILGSNAEQQSETTGKLLYLYHHFLNGTTMNTRIFGRDRAYNEKDGKTKEGEAVATLGSAVFKIDGVKDKVKNGMINKTKTDRYFDINLSNSATIEFRKGRGSIKASRISMVIEYCETMCKYAKECKWEEISKEHFIDYVVANINRESPLYRFFEAGERCDSSF